MDSIAHYAELMEEKIKCKLSPLYFIKKYVKVDYGNTPISITNEDMWTDKHEMFIRSVHKYENCIFMASRQLGKCVSYDTPIYIPETGIEQIGNFVEKYLQEVDHKIFENKGEVSRNISANNLFVQSYDIKKKKYTNSKIKKIYKGICNNMVEISYGADKLKLTPAHKLLVFNKEKQVLEEVPAININKNYMIASPKVFSINEKFNKFTNENAIKDGISIPSNIKQAHKKQISNKYLLNKVYAKNFLIEYIFNACKVIFYENKIHDIELYATENIYQHIGYMLKILGINYISKFEKGMYTLFLDPEAFVKEFASFMPDLPAHTLYKYEQSKFVSEFHDEFHLIEIDDIKVLEGSFCVYDIELYGKEHNFVGGSHPVMLHNTTLALIYGLWAMLFYPGYKVAFVTLDQKRALKSLANLKNTWQALPDFLRVNKLGRSDKLTYFELENGSRLDLYTVSGATPATTVGRGITVPGIIWDEVAFIKDAPDLWASLSQSTGTASQSARKNGLPVFKIFTSTPNGVGGVGGFFFDYCSNALNIDEYQYLYDPDKKQFSEEVYDILHEVNTERTCNGFMLIKLHWSEVKSKTLDWYKDQIRQMQYNMRAINQELDLKFLGSSTSILDDDILMQIETKIPLDTVRLGTSREPLNITGEITSGFTYLIGVDSASASDGDLCAVGIFRADDMVQVGEFKGRIPIKADFGIAIINIIKYLKTKGVNEDNIFLCIENNSYGRSVIEYLIYHQDELDVNDMLINYTKKTTGEVTLGINTNEGTRKQFVDDFIGAIYDNPKCITGRLLKDEIDVMENRNGKIIAMRGRHDDLFMACALCFYGRRKLDEDNYSFIADGNTKNNKKEIVKSNFRSIEKLMTSKIDSEIAKNRKETFSPMIAPNKKLKDGTLVYKYDIDKVIDNESASIPSYFLL